MDNLFPPDAVRLSQVMTQAAAPAFVLGAVAGFISILLGRLNSVVDRIRNLNAIPDSDSSRVHLKADLLRLRRCAQLLKSATLLALASGISTSMLLLVAFASAFLRLEHVYGAALLFVVAIIFLAAALFRFAQEVVIGVSEADHYG